MYLVNGTNFLNNSADSSKMSTGANSSKKNKSGLQYAERLPDIICFFLRSV